ncbi:MAG: hypothetical protein WCT01_04725 [Candidatus Shapirobacteria bacterium]|jgi:hypothetical protein
MELNQLFLSIMLMSITTVFVILAVWLLMVMRDVKDIIVKTNSILTDAQSVTSSIRAPLSSASEFLIGLKNGLQFVNQILDQFPKTKKRVPAKN